MHRAHRIRLNPTPEQERYFWQCAGVARFTWNWALAEYNAALQRKEKPNIAALKREFNRLRREEEFAPWIADVQSYAYQYAFQDLQTAISRYHERRKGGTIKPARKPRRDGCPTGWPRFKARDKTVPAFGLANRSCLRCVGHEARISRCPGVVNMAEELRFGGRILSGRVSYVGGHWYLAVCVELPDLEHEPLTGRVGVDLGIKSLAVTSDGVVYDNPKRLQQAQRKIARLQRELSRRQKGGQNRAKTQAKIGRLHERIANQRREALHEMTTDIVRTYGTVVIEDLNVQGMMRNHHLARSIADASFSEIRRQLEYKAAAHGAKIVIADRWYPSSKTCNQCGYIMKLSLSDRTWTCPECGTVHDRDLNAARNLRDLADSGEQASPEYIHGDVKRLGMVAAVGAPDEPGIH